MWSALLMALVVVPSSLCLVSIVANILVMRSSPQWPTSVHQLWIEIQFQFLGYYGVAMDKMHKAQNVVG